MCFTPSAIEKKLPALSLGLFSLHFILKSSDVLILWLGPIHDRIVSKDLSFLHYSCSYSKALTSVQTL